MLLEKRKKKRTIVFVCTGNTCRSPMAQGLLMDYLQKNNITNIEVKTAGVMTVPGLLPTPEVVQVMDNAGIDIRKHRSAQLTDDMIRKSDLVLGMTPFHVQYALRLSPDARGKTFLLKEYTKSDLKNYQITDPMGATLEVYKRVFREIKLAIDKLSELPIIHDPISDGSPFKRVKTPVQKPGAKAESVEAEAPKSKAAKPKAKAAGDKKGAAKPKSAAKPKAPAKKAAASDKKPAAKPKAAAKKPAASAKKPAAAKSKAKK